MNSESAHILVLASGQADGWFASLNEMGYHPTLVDGMFSALKRLKHNRFAALLIDYDDIQDDILELILNVRDVDREVPILVVGGPHNERTQATLKQREGVHVLPESREGIRAEVQRLIS